MTSLRTFFCFLMAVTIVTFALPSVAGNDKKQFSLQMNVVTVPPPTTMPYPGITLRAKITNEGNSTINSFRLSVSGMYIIAVTPPANGQLTPIVDTTDGSSVSVTNMHPLKYRDFVTVTLVVGSSGDGDWSKTTAWTGSSTNGQQFSLLAADSILSTSIPGGPPLASGDTFTVPDAINPGCVTGQRGFYDSGGSLPITVPFFMTNTVRTNRKAHLRWPIAPTDIVSDPHAVFEWAVCASGAFNPDHPPNTQVSWLNNPDGSPAFIPAKPCLSVYDANVFLPAPYGRLKYAVVPGDDKIYVNALATVPYGETIRHKVPPFDIVIGVGMATERMTVNTVTLINGEIEPDGCVAGLGDLCDPDERIEPDSSDEFETWEVTRAVLFNTTAQPHMDGALVMSTPLPYVSSTAGPPYIPAGGTGTKFVQAQMCISAQGPEVGNPNAHFTQFIDIGDGWSSEP